MGALLTDTDATGRRLLGGWAFVAGGVQYVVLEGVAAAAWADPGYDYVRNYISDLGVSVPQNYRGRDVDSPLSWLMNTAFVLEGLLFLLGALLLASLFAGIARRAFVAFAVLHCVGIVLVGFFDETAAAGPTHLIGAALSILFGNLAALVVGINAVRAGLPRWFAAASVALPVVGLLSEVMLFSGLTPESFDGLWERGGVYSITAWEVLFGAVVLVTLRSRRSAEVPISAEARL